MTRSLKRTAILALSWAMAWAPIALLIGVTIIDPDNSMDEMWPLVGAYPGFLCGLLFSALLGIAERGNRLGQVSVPRAALWGLLGGVLVGAIPTVLAEPGGLLSAWIIGSITLMSAVSAVVSVMIARKTKAPAFSV
jgi:hypothetical protein